MHNFRRFLEENYKDVYEMQLARIEEIVEQDASKMRKQASISLTVFLLRTVISYLCFSCNNCCSILLFQSRT